MKKVVVTEEKILEACRQGSQEIQVPKGAIITPSARDAAKIRQIKIQFQDNPDPMTSGKDFSPYLAGPSKSGPVAIGADHGGFALKSVLVEFLKSSGFIVKDFGTHSSDPVDYPDIAQAVAEAVAQGQAVWGIIIDGAGIGSAIVANKVPGIRAACCNDLFSAANSREHNGANVLTLGGRIIGEALAKKIVDTWLKTHFGGGRHHRRLQKVIAVDEKYRKHP